MDNNEFYIGWTAKAPTATAVAIRRFLRLSLPVLLVLAALLAFLQKKAATGIFENDRSTHLTGVLHFLPVPSLRIPQGQDIHGAVLFQLIPLLGYGKMGAGGTIHDLERKKGLSLEGRLVTLDGTLLYNDGKAFLQIDNDDSTLTTVEPATGINAMPVHPVDLGPAIINGEIADPKCYFGVMKPGEGKPHRDCAIRCILGGIPPVIASHDSAGRANYYLLVGPNGEKMNTAVQNWVAQPVAVRGRLRRYDDWIVLYADDTAAIRRVSYLKERHELSIISCNSKCFKTTK